MNNKVSRQGDLYNASISVVIATYNGERFIKDQLNSIAHQTIKPTEIIIIDDASTDNTVETVKKYISESLLSIKLYCHNYNEGYRKTFFEAIRKSKGDIVFLSDQDDIWKPFKVECVMKVFQNHPEILALNTNYDLIDGMGDPIIENKCFSRINRLKENGEIKRISSQKIINYNVAMGCTMAISRKLVNKIINHIFVLEKLNIPHDWAINIIASLDEGLFYFNKKLISYRLHERNTIGLDRARTIDQRISAYENIIKQKTDMKIITKEFYSENEDVMNYIDAVLDNYDALTRAMKTRLLKNYIVAVIKNNSYKYLSWKTIVYDGVLLIRKD